MTEPIIIIDTSEIREGHLREVQEATRTLAGFVDANEPRALLYHIYIDADGTRMTVVQVHPDSASMEYHMTAAAPIFRRLTGLLELSTMDVYGQPSDALLAQLRQKAGMLGRAAVIVHALHAGFSRVGAGFP